MSFKTSCFTIHSMQPITRCSDPESTPAVFKDGRYLVINEAVLIFRLMQVTGKCAIRLQTIESALIRMIIEPSPTCSNPDYTPMIFINGVDHIVAQAFWIARFIPVMDKFSCFLIQPIQPSEYTYPKSTLAIL